jgi:hypothetical protein
VAAQYDLEKFENVHQVGGIQLATIEPAFGGGAPMATRVAMINTGSGLRFNVALDRGGDIVEAFYNQHSLAYLSPVGVQPPNHANNRGAEWLKNWPAGLLTTCGPQYIGRPRVEDGNEVPLHGHHSNCPALVEIMLNPDPHRGRKEILLSMVIRDSRMFGPVVEVRRQIQCTLGDPTISLFDQVTNRGNKPCAHHWLYHVNLGYPLLDKGAKFIYRGTARYWEVPTPSQGHPILTDAALNRIKTVPGNIPEHVGGGERGMIVDVEADRSGQAHVGLVNRKLGLGVELAFPVEEMPRVANWQHLGPGGSFVGGIEPFSGSLMGKDMDDHPRAEQYLQPGETRRYQMTIHVRRSARELRAMEKHDGRVRSNVKA